MKIKYNGKETNLKSVIVTTVITLTFKIVMVAALYSTLKGMYITNEYLTIIFTLIGLNLIKESSIELTLE